MSSHSMIVSDSQHETKLAESFFSHLIGPRGDDISTPLSKLVTVQFYYEREYPRKKSIEHPKEKI